MPSVATAVKAPAKVVADEVKMERQEPQACYHCGVPCLTDNLRQDDHYFCCDGCLLVYGILNHNGLCDYYNLASHPGLSRIKAVSREQYAYLDEEAIASRLYTFTDGNHTIVTFYIPGVHCSSCMWLLEQLHRLHPGITESRLNFTSKEVTIHYLREEVGLRTIVELLATIGYAPSISLQDGDAKKAPRTSRRQIYKLGVAGFCFGNIMMLSFPEYFARHTGIDPAFERLFRYLNLLLSLPVVFYAASGFFITAWKGLRQKTLNIDAPIALAILITFSRSLYEILSGTGAGYLDSMSGIVFFMLAGRLVQERTYRSISFHRDYKSYFPIAVTVLTKDGTESRSLHDLKEGDIVELHGEELIPADSIVLQGQARIDYSFVTGESEEIRVAEGGKVYAGGRQTGGGLTLQIVQPVAGSYLTSLWQHHAFSNNKIAANKDSSIIHRLSKYFTGVLFTLAAITAGYWAFHDPSKIAPSVTAMLIVACPCALLLSATFTNGNLLRLFSRNGLFLRDASVIEQLGRIDHIVFDKTGTLTQGVRVAPDAAAASFREADKQRIYAVVRSSKHPYSKALTGYLGYQLPVGLEGWEELPGNGVTAMAGGVPVRVGSAAFVCAAAAGNGSGGEVYVSVGGKTGSYRLTPEFRESIPSMIPKLGHDFQLSLLSGDNSRQKRGMRDLFGDTSTLLFRQQPVDKLEYISRMQDHGHRVLMVGDGLNDAGALQQSNVGITLADDVNNFTPSCDAILDAKCFGQLPQLLQLSRDGRLIIRLSFAVSIIYNIIGLTISVQGRMNPMIAAILMPVSTLSIVLISTGLSTIIAKGLRLRTRG